jgi:leucyl aminopeptidase
MEKETMLNLTFVDYKSEKMETLVIPVCEDKKIHTDALISGIIRKATGLKEFKGEKDEVIILYNLAGVKAERVMLRGLGPAEKLEAETLRALAGKAVKDCIQKKLAAVWFAAPDERRIKMEAASMLGALMEGAYLGNHLFDKYKQEKKTKPLKQINLIVKPDVAKKFKQLAAEVTTICEGTILAREWISTPSNDKIPAQLTKMIVQQAKKQQLKIRVLDAKELKQKSFGALLAVAAGSDRQPSMVVLEYKPRGAKQTLALVGKGVTFDSGGLNLKTGPSMADMKADMSGAAAAAATLVTVAKLKPKLAVVAAIPIVENMPSGTATRPGDIVRSYSGKTIEIGNTDAEGRLILIDAISYVVKKFKPQVLIDLATLTGACVVALGEKIAGVFSNADDLAEAIIASGKRTHERCWPMPLPDDYKDLLKSDFADLNNISNTRWGGAITAALFLAEFAGQTRWAHIDIAGPAYIQKESAYCGPGGTGFGVRLLCDLIEKL